MYIAAIEDGEYMNEKIHFWDNVYGFDMSSIKELAYLEPLVDTVESEAVVTNQTKILEVNIETVTKEELDFLGEFKINARRSDYVHAFVAYFDCTFSKCHKPITFSTSPHSEYTHWKQTVFYLQNPIAIGPGEMITGKISCKRNANNPRDLDITIFSTFGNRIFIMLIFNSTSGSSISTTNPPANLDFILSCTLSSFIGGRSADIIICEPLSIRLLKV